MSKLTTKMIPIGRVRTSGLNHRKTFPAESMAELAASIKIHGILQPLVVRSLGHKQDWELIAGERRLRAAQLAGLTEVPVVVHDMTDEEAGAAALVENEQREDVNILERIEGYHSQIEVFGWSVKKLAGQVGKSESSIRSLLKLRGLPELSKQALADGRISISLATLIAERPTHELRVRMEDYVFGDGDTNIPSVRVAKDFISRELCVELKQATFSTAAKKLLPGAGSCKDCPKRVGNMEGEINGRADVCTDPACFRAKVEAHNKSQVGDLEKQGYNALSEEEAARVFGNFGQVRVDSIYYDLDDVCHKAPPGKRATWGKLLSGMIPAGEIYVRLESGGRLRKLIKQRWAEAALEHVCPTPKPEKPKPLPERIPLSISPLEKMIDEEDVEQRAKALEIYQRAADRLPGGEYGYAATEALRMLTWYFVEDGVSDEIEEAIRLYHQVAPDAKPEDVPDEPDLAALIGSQLLSYALAQLIARIAFSDYRGIGVMKNWFLPTEKAGVE